MSRNQRVSHPLCEGLKFAETTLLVFGVEFCKDTFVIRSSGCDEVIKNARQFVCGVFDRDRSAKAGSLRSIKVTEIGSTVVQGLGRETKCIGGAIVVLNSRSADATAGASSILGGKV